MATVKELLTQFQRDSSDVAAPSDITASSAPRKKTVRELLGISTLDAVGDQRSLEEKTMSPEQFRASVVAGSLSPFPNLDKIKLAANQLAELTKTITGTADQAQEFLRPIREEDQYGLGPFALVGSVPIGLLSGLIGMIGETPNKLINPELEGKGAVDATGEMVRDVAKSFVGSPFQLAELSRQIPQSMGVPDTVETPLGKIATKDMNVPAQILDAIGRIGGLASDKSDVEKFREEQIAIQQENPSVGVGNAAMISGALAGIGSAKTTLPKVGERTAYDIPGLGSETVDNPLHTSRDFITRQSQIEKSLEQGGGDFPSAQKIGPEAVPLGIESAARTFDKNPALKEIVYRPAQDALHNTNVRKVAEESEFNNTLKANDVGMTNRTAVSNAIGEYAISQQKGGIERLALEGKAAPELAPNEMTIYNHMRSGFEKHWRLMNNVRTSIGLDPIGYIENYFTFAQAMDEMAQSGINPVLADPKAVMARASRIAEESAMKNIKSRGSELKPLKTDAFGIYRNYIESAIKYEELTPHINRVNQLLDGTYGMDRTARPNVTVKGKGTSMSKTPKRGTPPEGATPLSEKFPNMAAYTKTWLNDIAGIKPPKGLNAKLESFVGRMQRNITRSALSFNVLSTLIQPTALVPAFSELGPRYLTEGVTLIGPGSKWRKIAMEKSRVLLGREYETAIADATAGIKGRAEGLMSGAGDAGLKFLKLGDLETARATWVGAYRKGMSEFGLSDANAIKYADDVVIRTQGSASPIDRAPIQRSQLGRAASVFGTYTMNNWGYMTRDLLGRGAIKRNAAAQMEALIQYGIANQLVNTIYGKYSPQPNPIAAIEQYRKDHPKDRSNAELLAAMSEFWKVVPIVGQGVRFGNVQLGGPIAGLGNDIGKVLTGKPDAKPIRVAGELLGVPGTVQAQKIIDSSKKKKKKTTR